MTVTPDIHAKSALHNSQLQFQLGTESGQVDVFLHAASPGGGSRLATMAPLQLVMDGLHLSSKHCAVPLTMTSLVRTFEQLFGVPLTELPHGAATVEGGDELSVMLHILKGIQVICNNLTSLKSMQLLLKRLVTDDLRKESAGDPVDEEDLEQHANTLLEKLSITCHGI